MSAEEYTLGGLFLSAFIASTIFPGGSEVVLAVLVAQETYDPWVLFGVATAGQYLRRNELLGAWSLDSLALSTHTTHKSAPRTSCRTYSTLGKPALAAFLGANHWGPPLCSSRLVTDQWDLGTPLYRIRKGPAICYHYCSAPVATIALGQ